jgi:hypothetical protein
MFYLSPDHWSPRFGDDFFTIEMEKRRWVEPSQVEGGGQGAGSDGSLNDIVADAVVPSQRRCRPPSGPALYYDIKIKYGNFERIILRRYSQFQWLHSTLSLSPPIPSTPELMPEEELPPSPLFSIKTPYFAGCIRFPCFCFCDPKSNNNDSSGGSSSQPHKSTSSSTREEDRQECLRDFLEDTLSRPGYVSDERLVCFLELDQLQQHKNHVLNGKGASPSISGDLTKRKNKRSVVANFGTTVKLYETT